MSRLIVCLSIGSGAVIRHTRINVAPYNHLIWIFEPCAFPQYQYPSFLLIAQSNIIEASAAIIIIILQLINDSFYSTHATLVASLLLLLPPSVLLADGCWLLSCSFFLFVRTTSSTVFNCFAIIKFSQTK